MRDLSRRDFLALSARAGAAFAGAAAFGGLGGFAFSGCKGKNVPIVHESRRVVVIGTGFGGAIAAYRLSRLGIDTLVLERGRRWPITPAGDTFPNWNRPDRRCAWLSDAPTFPESPVAAFKPYVGLIERIEGEGMDVVCGAGVGGSSLAYGAMMLQPSRELFYRVFPSDLDYDELAREHYPRVARMIGLARIPDDILGHVRYTSSRLYLEHAARAGLDGERILDACDWSVVRDELQGRAVPSASVGDLVYGINSGAKSSVDRNYLALAERNPCIEVRPLHAVQDVREGTGGRFVVEAYRITEDGEPVEKRVIECEKLFMAAGTMNTTKLLARARGNGSLPRLNSQVGEGWGNNGDRLYLRYALREDTLPHQGTPACTAIYDWNNPKGPVTIEHGPAPFEIEMHAMALLGMGIPEQRGRFVYDPGADDVRLHWPRGGDDLAQQAVRSTLDVLTDKAGGAILDLNWLGRPSTYHPLGGMVLGQACDYNGRVEGYRNLYVVDASLIPGSTACCNPAWTVAALAERCMDTILAEDFRA